MNARKEVVKQFLSETGKLIDKEDRDDVDAILQISISANKELYDQIRKEDIGMCEAMRELFKDELRDMEEKGRIEGKIEAYYDEGYTPDKIAEKMNTSIEKVREVLNLTPTTEI